MNKLLYFYRYLRNYITISISGGFPERFFNLCNNEKIYMWDTSFADSKIYANMYCKDFLRLRKIRIKSGTKIKIVKKHGIYFFFQKNSKRKALVLGLALSFMMLIFLNQFVWNIEIKGSDNISRNEILSVCESLGLKYGTFVPLFDEQEAGREAVNLFNGRILWMAINIKGSKATIEVRDYEKKETDKAEEPLSNIVADFDGVILSAENFSGVLSTVVGSAVKKGDLLVSGISENSDGSVNFHNAEGRLTALHKSMQQNIYKNQVKAEKINQEYSYTVIDIFSIKIPLSYKYFFTDSDILRYNKNYIFDGKTLPFGFEKISALKKTKSEADYSDVLFCVDEFTKDEYIKFKNTFIVDSQYSILKEKDGYNITADFDCIDFIGKKSPILQEN